MLDRPQAGRRVERAGRDADRRAAGSVPEQARAALAAEAAPGVGVALGAEDYADDILNTLEVNLTKFIAAVQRGRDRLQGREEAEVG